MAAATLAMQHWPMYVTDPDTGSILNQVLNSVHAVLFLSAVCGLLIKTVCTLLHHNNEVLDRIAQGQSIASVHTETGPAVYKVPKKVYIYIKARFDGDP